MDEKQIEAHEGILKLLREGRFTVHSVPRIKIPFALGFKKNSKEKEQTHQPHRKNPYSHIHTLDEISSRDSNHSL